MSPMRSIAALLVGFLLAGGPALAETTDPISVKVNMARILRISAPAATSQGWRGLSQNASNLPAATQARSRAAAPSRRTA